MRHEMSRQSRLSARRGRISRSLTPAGKPAERTSRERVQMASPAFRAIAPGKAKGGAPWSTALLIAIVVRRVPRGARSAEALLELAPRRVAHRRRVHGLHEHDEIVEVLVTGRTRQRLVPAEPPRAGVRAGALERDR